MNSSLNKKGTESSFGQSFKQHTGIAVPMMQNNIDTDQIIPSREMKKVSKDGLSEGLFAGQRYLASSDRTPNPDFILNKAPYDQATILLSSKNFGCGSSREHAAWALKEYGFKAVIAESFGNIFRINCLRNGIVPILLSDTQIAQLDSEVAANPKKNKIRVDVENKVVVSPKLFSFSFELESHFQEMLIGGLDFISLTMKRKDSIDEFIKQDKTVRPWAYL